MIYILSWIPEHVLTFESNSQFFKNPNEVLSMPGMCQCVIVVNMMQGQTHQPFNEAIKTPGALVNKFNSSMNTLFVLSNYIQPVWSCIFLWLDSIKIDLYEVETLNFLACRYSAVNYCNTRSISKSIPYEAIKHPTFTWVGKTHL